MSEAFERLRDRLHEHGSTIRDNKQGHFMAQCPHHGDNNPSLGVDDKGDRVMVRCYAGCHTDDVVAALGMELKDLFDGEPDRDNALPIRSYVYVKVNGEPWIIKDRYFPKTFVQRLPGTEPGDRTGLHGRVPILYRADRLWRALRAGGATVWLVDGEKDVETGERHGLLITCAPGGAGARWREEFTQFLSAAEEVIIVADQDVAKMDGTLGTGQQYAASARDSLRAAGVKVKIVRPAAGKDLTDHFTAGFDKDAFTVEPTTSLRPRGLTASELAVQEFKPVVFCVEGILPEGLAVLAGSPKSGKSWIALSISLAVSAGGLAMGGLRTMSGSVLYLAREDTYRRLQSRIHLLTAGDMDAGSIENLELVPAEVEWEGGMAGLAAMTEWHEEQREPRLVVIDTLQKVEPDMGEDGRKGVYAANYTMMSRYKRWADHHGCTVLCIHHDRKGDNSKTDPFDRFSGTRGITGAADTLLFVESERGTRDGVLHVTGRDVIEDSLAMRKVGPIWQMIDRPEQPF